VLQQPSGFTRATFTSNVLTSGTAGTAADITNSSSGTANSLGGQAVTFRTGPGAAGTTTITLGTAAGSVNSITDLNTALAAKNIQLTASLNATTGQLTFTSTNEAASQIINNTGAFVAVPAGSTASSAVDISGAAGSAFNAVPAANIVQAVADPVGQNTRAGLVNQFNQIITQITTTAQDASFNGVNLLNGDSLKLVFDETGKSTSTITGVTFDPNGLGLRSLVSGTDFIDNVTTNSVLASLNTASITLRSQASAFGANLSIVQVRQDFNKNLINVLQTGSSNLTLADSNEEAANSQALSTRQSIATSALSLANQAQQNVLQLLR
jgi:hypothetical protein